jgi:hypothetical protein
MMTIRILFQQSHYRTFKAYCFLRHVSDLTFACSSCAYPRHRFATRSRTRKKPIGTLDKPFQEAIILFDEGVEVFALPQFTSF